MKILTISDVVVDLIHSPALTTRFSDVDLVISCGDLSIGYLEYIVTILNKPLYYVNGNHTQHMLLTEEGPRVAKPEGCIDIHRRVINHKGLLIAGLEGSMCYNDGPHQYSDSQMAFMSAMLAPRLWWNKLRYGRALDIFVTHAPPLGIGDGDDVCHRGFRAYLNFMDRHKPRYLIHGHVHLYRLDAPRVSHYGETTIINTYGYQIIEIDDDSLVANR